MYTEIQIFVEWTKCWHCWWHFSVVAFRSMTGNGQSKDWLNVLDDWDEELLGQLVFLLDLKLFDSNYCSLIKKLFNLFRFERENNNYRQVGKSMFHSLELALVLHYWNWFIELCISGWSIKQSDYYSYCSWGLITFWRLMNELIKDTLPFHRSQFLPPSPHPQLANVTCCAPQAPSNQQ